MLDELNALIINNTWFLVPLPDGSWDRYKARLAAKGFHKRQGLEYLDTFSLVVKPIAIQIILTLVLTNNWFVNQLDVQNAFLNGNLPEVYMIEPPRFVNQMYPNNVCRFHCSLYCLKQSANAFVLTLGRVFYIKP